VQGTEWLPGIFFRQQELYGAALTCVARDSRCLDGWMAATGEHLDYLVLTRGTPDDCCGALRSALASDSRYTVVYDAPGTAIFAFTGGN
jgi:hypothetical protein